MSSPWTQSLTQIFRAQHPHWACEFTSKHLIVAGVDRGRTRVQGRTIADLPDGVDIQHPEGLKTIVRKSLEDVSFRGADIAVVIPDDAARIAFVTTETLPKTVAEQQTVLRWKLKKSIPFDVDSAQIAFRVLRSRPGGHDIVVALSPRSIIEGYEELFDAFDIQAGFVVPSTLAALNLIRPPEQDTLFVKVAPDCVTTTIFQNKQMTFYRRVAELGLYESVYPTVLYYQDKLGGTAIGRMTVCGDDNVTPNAIADLADRIGIRAFSLDPADVDDIYKPALGAVHLSWPNLN